jgi:hypothetical protein
VTVDEILQLVSDYAFAARECRAEEKDLERIKQAIIEYGCESFDEGLCK